MHDRTRHYQHSTHKFSQPILQVWNVVVYNPSIRHASPCLHLMNDLKQPDTYLLAVEWVIEDWFLGTIYSGQFLAFLKSCETQDKFPNFLRDLQDLQDSNNFQFFLLFLSFQPEKVINFTTNIFYVWKQCIILNKTDEN